MGYTLNIPLDELLAAYAAGASVNSLAVKYGCDNTCIESRLVKHGAVMRRTPRLPKIPRAEAIQLYEGGMLGKDVGKKYGRTPRMMLELLKKWGCKMRDAHSHSRKYELNHRYFDVIDTEEKAYWLGFLLADGNVSHVAKNSSVLALALKLEDKPHIEKFLKAIETNTPITLTHKGQAHTVRVCSRPLCDALEKLECVPRKTCNHGTPELPEHLKRHFYRGYTDGDGCITFSENGNAWAYYVTGAFKFIDQFQNWLCQRVGLNKTKVENAGKAVRLGYGGSRQVAKIVKELYEGATVFLDRKFAKAQALFESRKVYQLAEVQ